MLLRQLPLFLAVITLSACAARPSENLNQASSSIPPFPGTTGSSEAQEVADIEAGDVPTESASGALTSIAERVLPGGILEIGKADAPVSLLVFTNHSCSYCRQFHREQFPRLLAEYVADGLVRVNIVPFQLQKYPQSAHQASLSLCAARQGQGRAAQDALYDPNAAEPAGLQDCLRDPSIAEELKAQRAWARALGVELIPTFIINGQRVTGLPDYAELRGELDGALSEAEER